MRGKYHLGFKGVNRENLEYEIIEYKDNKHLKIKFLIDNTVLKTTGAYLTKGLPLHPTHNLPKQGDRFPCKDGDIVEIVEYISAAECRIKWLSDGAEATREISAIRTGVNKHPHNWKPKVGDIVKVRKSNVTVLAYNSTFDIDVMFEDGSIVKTTNNNLKLGIIGHPTSYIEMDKPFKTKSGWEGIPIKYNSCYSIDVKWQDGSISNHPASHISKGSIKPLFQPSVVGVGYLGDGRFGSGLKKNQLVAPEVILNYWRRMLTRCFDPLELKKQSSMNYLNVEVCNEWFNFQNFAEWAISQPNWDMCNELDKDLLGTGFLYSPENCTFLPMEVNIFLTDSYAREVHNLPKGVQYLKPATVNSKVGYIARCHTDKGREYLGYYDTPEEAFVVYKQAKETYAKVLAERYKSKMTDEAYEKLKAFVLQP